MRVHSASLILLFGLGAFAAPAQDAAPGPLTLEQAVAAALAQSHQLQAADAAAKAALATRDEARSYKGPRVELTELVSRTTNPTFVFMNLLGQENFGPANFDPAFLNEPPALNNFNTALRVTQPIYAGGKIASGAAAAEYAAEAASSDNERARQQVVHQVVQAYTGAILAAAHLKVAEEALATSKAHVKLAEDLRAAGMVVESDLLQARLQQAEVEESIARARAGVAVSRAGLNLAMGQDIETPLLLPDALDAPAIESEDLDGLIAQARASRRDLQAASRRLQAADQMIRANEAGRLPEVGLSGAYEANAEDFIGADGTNWSVFLMARFTVFDGKKTGSSVVRAREELRAAQAMTELMRQSVGLEVVQAYHELDAARQRLTLAEASVKQAGESLRIVEDRYKEGLTTIVELLGAQTMLTAARAREVSARRDVLLGRATLDLAVGRL